MSEQTYSRIRSGHEEVNKIMRAVESRFHNETVTGGEIKFEVQVQVTELRLLAHIAKSLHTLTVTTDREEVR
jgi:hypothetical protein